MYHSIWFSRSWVECCWGARPCCRCPRDSFSSSTSSPHCLHILVTRISEGLERLFDPLFHHTKTWYMECLTNFFCGWWCRGLTVEGSPVPPMNRILHQISKSIWYIGGGGGGVMKGGEGVRWWGAPIILMNRTFQRFPKLYYTPALWPFQMDEVGDSTHTLILSNFCFFTRSKFPLLVVHFYFQFSPSSVVAVLCQQYHLNNVIILIIWTTKSTL